MFDNNLFPLEEVGYGNSGENPVSSHKRVLSNCLSCKWKTNMADSLLQPKSHDVSGKYKKNFVWGKHCRGFRIIPNLTIRGSS